MKSTEKTKRNGLNVFSFIIVALLLTAGCQKDQMATPNNSNASKSISAINSEPSLASAYPMLTIVHEPGNSIGLPGYSVTVYYNGTIVYMGYRNVAKTGQVEFQSTKEQLAIIETAIKQSNFFAIVDNLTFMPDVPYVQTTYMTLPPAFRGVESSSPSPAHRRTLIDFNAEYPVALITLRTNVENTLNIFMLVNGDRQAGF